MRGVRAVTVAAVGGALVLSLACSEATRYRVLSFFLDGVPVPGVPPPTSLTGAPVPSLGPVQPAGVPAQQRLIPHTPYRENRCGGCHDADSGQLIRSVEEGLCLTCHGRLVADLRFVHGPVAVNACTVCHHYHAAPFPNLLLAESVTTCLNCHDLADLSTGGHHPALEARACTDCHDPHGGDDRLFVKGSVP